MSSTSHLRYRENIIWATDVVLNVLTKHLIDAANPQQPIPWASETLDGLITACLMGVGHTFDSNLQPHHFESFIAVIHEACQSLKKRKSIPAAEITSWKIAPDYTIFMRGQSEISTKAVSNLGKALIDLLQNRLHEPPPRTMWFYSYEDTPRTLDKHEWAE